MLKAILCLDVEHLARNLPVNEWKDLWNGGFMPGADGWGQRKLPLAQGGSDGLGQTLSQN